MVTTTLTPIAFKLNQFCRIKIYRNSYVKQLIITPDWNTVAAVQYHRTYITPTSASFKLKKWNLEAHGKMNIKRDH